MKTKDFLFLILLIFGGVIYAQESSEDASELAKKAQNPIANMISLPFQNNLNFGMGPFERNQNILNIQPVLPVNISDNWLLVNRAIVPLISQPDIASSSGGVFGLGDIIYEGFFVPSGSGNITWGVGPVLSIPTASDELLGTGKFSAGPTAILVAFVNKWVLGAVAYNTWSFAGNGNRDDVNSGFVQYFINYNLPKAWYITSSPSITVNWNAPEGDQWIVPFGGGVGKIFAIGKQKFNGQLAAYYNAVKSETLDGPDWSFRVQLVLLFPK